MATLEHASALAATAHAGPVDKAGAPYILHVLHIAAVLHDVAGGWSLERLRNEGFADRDTARLKNYRGVIPVPEI